MKIRFNFRPVINIKRTVEVAPAEFDAAVDRAAKAIAEESARRALAESAGNGVD